MGDELLLVGSIPLDTPQGVFETFGAPLGKYLFAIPDGEVGPRRHWISRVHYQVLAAHPELEVVQHPAPDESGVERQVPRNVTDAWWFKVKDGVKRVRFGDPGWRLGYARDAINSYFVFCALREKGVLPSHLRFQVSIPMVNSVLPPRIFPKQDDIEKVRPGYEEATRAELPKLSRIFLGRILPSSGTARLRYRILTAAFPDIRLKEPSSETSPRSETSRRISHQMSRLAIISVLGHSVDGRGSNPTISANW